MTTGRRQAAAGRTARVVLIAVLLSGVGSGCGDRTPKHGGSAGGFSRADEFHDEIPVVTTRLYKLDANGFPADLPATVEAAQANVFTPRNAWEELDDIYGLMALAVVHADWQEKSLNGGAPRRGHNIGGIIVNPDLEVVNWERNSNAAMCNGTQHGEVRTMTKQLHRTGSNDLFGYQIYTSLEPCMMCSGMMMQQKVLRTVYMQTDNKFGKNIERLTIDTTQSPVRFDGEDTGQNGYGPAARPVISSMSASEYRQQLDVAWHAASATAGDLTAWLQTPEAQRIYSDARDKFERYPLRFGDRKADVRFIVPGSRQKPQQTFTELTASKTNAELYRDALAFFHDPARGITPYTHRDGPAGSGPLVEDTTNVFATRLLEDPSTLARAEHPPDDTLPPLPPIPHATAEVIDGWLNGQHVHQERIRFECPKRSASSGVPPAAGGVPARDM